MQEGEEGGYNSGSVVVNWSRSDERLLTRSEVDGRDVRAVDTGPVLKVDALGVKQVFLQLRRVIGLRGDGVAADASIVDQDAQALLAGLDLLHQLGDVVLARDVESTQRYDVALNVLAVRLLDLVELLSAATCDVDLCNVSLCLRCPLTRFVSATDLCTVDGQGLCDHQTDTAATSSDESDATLEVEQTIAIEIAMAGSCDALCCHSGCLCR